MDQGGGVMNIEKDLAGTLRSQTHGHEPIIMATGQGKAEVLTFDRQSSGEYGTAPIASTVSARDYKGAADLVLSSSVRRLTPKECERLQGFPDDWTLIPWRGKMAPDGPRYKACGNSMAVPVMNWIGERIKKYD